MSTTTIPDRDWRRLLERDPEALADCGVYGPLIATTAPLVLGRIAQTLDGRIATDNGASFWISGQADILHTHRLRALFDAIVVGGRTVQADDPLLTTRLCAGPSPVRVILDTDRRLGPDYRVFRGDPLTLVACADDVPGPDTVGAAKLLRLPRASDGGLRIPALLAALAARGLSRVFVEGGGVTVSRFLAAGALHRLHVTVAPLLLGSGIPAFTFPGAERPDDGRRLHWTLHRLGEDVLFDIDLTKPA